MSNNTPVIIIEDKTYFSGKRELTIHVNPEFYDWVEALPMSRYIGNTYTIYMTPKYQFQCRDDKALCIPVEARGGTYIVPEVADAPTRALRDYSSNFRNDIDAIQQDLLKLREEYDSEAGGGASDDDFDFNAWYAIDYPPTINGAAGVDGDDATVKIESQQTNIDQGAAWTPQSIMTRVKKLFQ